jgi:hypothetical protein
VAEVYPEAHWPGQIADALRGLIHDDNTAREQDLDQIDEQTRTELITWFRRGIRVGLAQVPPAAGKKDKQPPGRPLLEVLRDREADVLRFAHDLNVPPTSNDAERDLRQPRPSRRSPAGSAPSRPPPTATASAGTPPPPPSTASTSSPPSATHYSAGPGHPPPQHPPETPTPPHDSHPRHRDLNSYRSTCPTHTYGSRTS